eukprot:344975-Pleurochrysis_carterae.AAC.1
MRQRKWNATCCLSYLRLSTASATADEAVVPRGRHAAQLRDSARATPDGGGVTALNVARHTCATRIIFSSSR